MGIMPRKLSRRIHNGNRRICALPSVAAAILCIGVTGTAAFAAPPGGDEAPVASDSELMLKALTAERGESPNARRIERAAAQARVDSMRRRAATVVTVWKDPFAENPEQPIEVRMPASKKQRRDEVASMRRDLARARAETAAAQATAAAAQAEAARAKANTARAEAEAARAQAVAARQEAAAARAECVATDRVPKKVVRPRETESRDDHVGFGRLAVARAGRSESTGPRLAKMRPQRSTPAKVPVAANPPPAPVDELTEPPPPPEVRTAAPGSIIVVPITR